jgi:hypothetical protein
VTRTTDLQLQYLQHLPHSQGQCRRQRRRHFLTATTAGHMFGAKSQSLTAKSHSEFAESEEFSACSAVRSLKFAVRIGLAIAVFAVCESIEPLLVTLSMQ